MKNFFRCLNSSCIILKEKKSERHSSICSPSRIARVAAFRSPTSRQTSIQASAEYAALTKHRVSLSKVWIQVDRASRDPNCIFRVSGYGKHKRQGLMGFWVGRCQTNSLLDPMAGSLECRSRRTYPPAHTDMRMAQSEQ